VRRTRIGGDGWEAADVPLAEEGERYEVDVTSGSEVLRTLTATAPSAIYTAAEQIEDFGAVQPAVTVRVAQVSASFGRGAVREAVV